MRTNFRANLMDVIQPQKFLKDAGNFQDKEIIEYSLTFRYG